MAGIRGIRVEKPKVGLGVAVLNAATSRRLEKALESGRAIERPLLLEKKELFRKILDAEIRDPAFVDSSHMRALFSERERPALRKYVEQYGRWKTRRETVDSALRGALSQEALGKAASHFTSAEFELLRKH
ncbi:MAG TPA: hypothetical protein VGQ00_01655, partial [Candidatus Norongarragalinales archaeon]|nr:hypothetical protein [Candidatus Norongarragalinales archaeon]